MTTRVYTHVLHFLAARLRRVLPLLLPIALAQPGWAATYYVSPTGSDSNPGTFIGAPFQTIQHAMDRVFAGDTVVVRGGTYREQVEARHGGTVDFPVNVVAYPGEIPVIKGSDRVTGWVMDTPKVWKKTGWPHNSQQVFVDFNAAPKKSLQQIGMPSQYYSSWEYPNPVGSGRSSMVPGSFYYDPASLTLYVWLKDNSDPNRRQIEVSVRRRLFQMHQPYIHVKGLRFRHSSLSAFAQQGAAVELSSHSVIENCDIQYVDFEGLSMGYLQDQARAYNCTVSNNGAAGASAAGSTNFWLANVTMKYNNSRNFNPMWHAGGFKGAAKAHGTIEHSEVAYNNGPGIWFDYANGAFPIVIRNNHVHDNSAGEAGIFLEVSNNGLVYNNVVANNKRRGIYVAAGNNTRIYNNTIYAITERAGIEIAGMPRGSATLKNNLVQNNTVSHGTGQYDLYLQPSNGTTIAGNRSDYNNYYRPGSLPQLRSGSVFSDLAAWHVATGQDEHSISADPDYVSAGGSALGYAVAAGSPVIDAGLYLGAAVDDDYRSLARPAGYAYDIGAFEFDPTATPTAVLTVQ